MTPYKMQNLVYKWIDFSKFGQIWAKIVEEIGNFVRNLAPNWADWYMNGLLFLEKLVFVWNPIYFQILWQPYPYQNQT